MYVSRKCRRRPLSGRDDAAPDIVSLDDCGEARVVVLLGEPGLGKSTEFEEAARRQGSEVIPLGTFLNRSLRRWEGQNTLWLDGLDEQRARARGQPVLEQIVGRLDELGCPKVRLSCRTLDWHGGSDMSELRDIAGGEPIHVLNLLPLDREDIAALLRSKDIEPDAFIHGAQDHGLESMLPNPLTLDLLITVHRDGSGWPESRAALYQQACDVLLREENETHLRVIAEGPADPTIAQAADEIAALFLLSNTETLALNHLAADTAVPALTSLPGYDPTMALAARRRVFSPGDAPERVKPRHRTILEYMAARHLARRVRDGLPVGRVLALICGHDGGTLSDLRGVYGWLCTLLPEKVAQLTARDSVGAVTYGDAARWTVDGREAVLRHLFLLARRDPWFRSDWSSRPWAPFAIPELAGTLGEMLESDATHLTVTALDALESGGRVAALDDRVERLALDDRQRGLTFRAAEALAHQWADDADRLITLLRTVERSPSSPDRDDVLAVLLKALVPAHLPPTEVVKHFGQLSRHHIGRLHHFLEDLPDKLDADGLRILADGLAGEHPECLSLTEERAIGFLVCRLLTEYGATERPGVIHKWLSLGTLHDCYRAIHEDYYGSCVRAFVKSRPDLMPLLLRIHLLKNRGRVHPSVHSFSELVQFAPWPAGMSHQLLIWTRIETDRSLKELLFQLTIELALLRDSEGEVTDDDIWAAARWDAILSDALEGWKVWPVSDWRWKAARRKVDGLAKRRKAIQRVLQRSIDLRAGRDLDVLCSWAFQVAYNSTHEERDKTLRQRLVARLDEDAAAILEDGIIAALHHPDLPTPESLARQEIDGDTRGLHSLIKAGTRLLLDREGVEGLQRLPTNTLLMAFLWAKAAELEEDDWRARLCDVVPERIRDGLLRFWSAFLDHAPDQVPDGLWNLLGADHISGVMAPHLQGLLQKYPDPSPRTLTSLLRAALSRVAPEDLRPFLAAMCRSGLAPRPENGAQWLAAGAFCGDADLLDGLSELLEAAPDLAWAVLELVAPLVSRGEAGVSGEVGRQALLPLLLKHFRNVPHTFGTRYVGRRDREEAAHSLRRIIDDIASSPTEEAGALLTRLRNDPDLGDWHDAQSHAAATQAEQRRQALFAYADFQGVHDTLRGGPPANAADLQALAHDVLADVQNYLRNGDTDGWKAFWNTDARGRPTTPRAENECRDRLNDFLKERLREVVVSREGDFAEHKRADITVSHGDLLLPIEAKRTDHPDLWTAAERQLVAQYCRDPRSGGRGIYLVFWFGPDLALKPRPDGACKPATPEELRRALIETMPAAHRDLIAVHILDLSRP